MPLGKATWFCTYSLGAGELGRYVEIDEVLSHEDVGHAITIVSDLQNQVSRCLTSGKEPMRKRDCLTFCIQDSRSPCTNHLQNSWWGREGPTRYHGVLRVQEDPKRRRAGTAGPRARSSVPTYPRILTGPKPPPLHTYSGFLSKSNSSTCCCGVWLVDNLHGSDKTCGVEQGHSLMTPFPAPSSSVPAQQPRWETGKVSPGPRVVSDAGGLRPRRPLAGSGQSVCREGVWTRGADTPQKKGADIRTKTREGDRAGLKLIFRNFFKLLVQHSIIIS